MSDSTYLPIERSPSALGPPTTQSNQFCGPAAINQRSASMRYRDTAAWHVRRDCCLLAREEEMVHTEFAWVT